jgi:hypothetical protein
MPASARKNRMGNPGFKMVACQWPNAGHTWEMPGENKIAGEILRVVPFRYTYHVSISFQFYVPEFKVNQENRWCMQLQIHRWINDWLKYVA